MYYRKPRFFVLGIPIGPVLKLGTIKRKNHFNLIKHEVRKHILKCMKTGLEMYQKAVLILQIFIIIYYILNPSNVYKGRPTNVRSNSSREQSCITVYMFHTKFQNCKQFNKTFPKTNPCAIIYQRVYRSWDTFQFSNSNHTG